MARSKKCSGGGLTALVMAAINLMASRRGGWGAMAAGAILLLSPGMTRAQTCTGLVAIDYPVGHNFPVR